MNQTEKTGNALGLPSSAFVEAMWETLIALAITAAISISLISLSAHLDKVKTLRDAALQSGAVSALSSVHLGGAEAATNLN
jgi:hypothetical protein